MLRILVLATTFSPIDKFGNIRKDIIALFFVPMFLENILPTDPSLDSIIVGSFLTLVSLGIYIKPIRNKSMAGYERAILR